MIRNIKVNQGTRPVRKQQIQMKMFSKGKKYYINIKT